ncbi:D-alanine--D-alanine ligase family protein [Bogoriella caseilytica]|uniref:D-alanine--D-alanine ligase n=1 Tax=Bogoriella caseilytica TaxID=56055 RepID=A0A3N2BGM3_9MICO|nr:ATP-grasp domain-containing protein [Bogoriella caseilytica]ROR74375.1 D-alanine--D-alanine ligase [Bogoriella caseilytica]
MSGRVVVIGGGQNVEHEVSVASATAVSTALRHSGVEVERWDVGTDGLWWIGGDPLGVTPAQSLAAAVMQLRATDVVFPCVHGPLGEDGVLAALCALAQVRVVGSGVAAGAVGKDKQWSKVMARDAGVQVTPGFVVSGADAVAFEREVVVKPVSSGSSHGVSLVADAAELAGAIRRAGELSSDGGVLVEHVVHGREIDVAVLREADGTRWAAPPLEIHASGLFDTATKYNGSARFTVPAALEPAETQALSQAALDLFDAFGCRGVARMDFFLTDHGVVFNEVNTMPGMTAASQVPRMFRAAGVEYDELVRRLVAGAAIPGHSATGPSAQAAVGLQ